MEKKELFRIMAAADGSMLRELLSRWLKNMVSAL